MYGTQKCQLRNLSKKESLALVSLLHLGKNMYNVGLYNIRQHFFKEKTYLSYEKNNQESKLNENYKLLNTDVAQQILKKVDEGFKSFFAKIKSGDKTARIPSYLEKEGYFEITFPRIKLQKDGSFFLPMSPAFKKEYGKIVIPFPKNLLGKKICEVRIRQKYDCKYFEVEYVYEVDAEKWELDETKAIAIDLGLDNLASCITTDGASFLLDGKKLKSMNHWYNKKNAKLQSIKDMQGIVALTKAQVSLLTKRNHQVRDYLNKAARYLVNYCKEHRMGTLVIGHNVSWKDSIEIGKRNNQNFVQIPHSQFIDKIESLCKRYGIRFIKTEESYTSIASFLDGDDIPVYGSVEGKKKFSGTRVKRGLYKTKEGFFVNADINGACNILKKSGVFYDFSTVAKTLRQNPVRVTLLQKKKEAQTA